jgi:hypothetical protein
LDLSVAGGVVALPVRMHHEVLDSDFVLVSQSPAYQRRNEGDAAVDERRGAKSVPVASSGRAAGP